MNPRRSLLVACLAGILSVGAAMAQTTPPAAQAGSASLTHSAVKATTLKIATSVTNFVVLSAATGGVVGGTVLTVFSAVSAWLIYTGNDYLWDTYEPPPVRQTTGESFDTTGDVWRNTLKYLTFKPMVLAVKWSSILVYTGSVTTMLVFGTASSVTNAAVFYANNVAWDFYDWYASTPQQPAVARP
jgi:uncharacterized membrane protein